MSIEPPAAILAGCDVDAATGKNADAQTGVVTVAGDWISSNLIAGVSPASANGFGNSDDTAVIVKGHAIGFPDSTDAALFGIEAQKLGSIKIGVLSVTPGAGVANDLFAVRHPLGTTLDTADFDFHAFDLPLTSTSSLIP